MTARLEFPNLEFCVESSKSSLDRERARLGNPEYIQGSVLGGLASGYSDVANYLYAAGGDLSEVKCNLLQAVQYFEKVLEHRHSIPGFTHFEVEVPDSQTDESPPVVVEQTKDKDYSTTNSRKHLRYVYMAAAIGDCELATRLARSIWDPPDAFYIGPDSTVCNLWRQAIAYSVREYLGGSVDSAKGTNRQSANC